MRVTVDIKVRATVEIDGDGRVRDASTIYAGEIERRVLEQYTPEQLLAAHKHQTRPRLDEGLVRVVGSYGHLTEYAKLVRVTKTQLVLDHRGRETRWSRRHGREHGSGSGLASWRVHHDDLRALDERP